MGSRKSPSIDHAYHEALREAYVALGGDPKGMLLMYGFSFWERLQYRRNSPFP